MNFLVVLLVLGGFLLLLVLLFLVFIASSGLCVMSKLLIPLFEVLFVDRDGLVGEES